MGVFSWLNNVSLKYKFAALLLFFGVVPALGMYGLLLSLRPDMQKTSEQTMRRLSITMMDQMERTMFERYGDVQAFALNATAHDPANWRRPDPTNPLIVAMNAYAKAYGIYEMMLMVDKQGKVLAVNTKNAQGQDIKTQSVYELDFANVPWFKRAMAGDFTKSAKLTGTVVEQPTVSNMVAQINGDDGFVMTFAAPVYNSAGELIGVWANFANFNFVEEIAEGTYNRIMANGYRSAIVKVLGPNGEAGSGRAHV